MTITFVCRSSKVSKKDGLIPLELNGLVVLFESVFSPF